MTPDKATLETELNRLTQDWTQMQAVAAQRQQEIRQLHEQIAQKSAEIERQSGAVAYNQILAERIKSQLAEIEKSAVSVAS